MPPRPLLCSSLVSMSTLPFFHFSERTLTTLERSWTLESVAALLSYSWTPMKPWGGGVNNVIGVLLLPSWISVLFIDLLLTQVFPHPNWPGLCFFVVVINPRVLSANRVNFGLFCFINFPISPPPPRSKSPLFVPSVTSFSAPIKRLRWAGGIMLAVLIFFWGLIFFFGV